MIIYDAVQKTVSNKLPQELLENTWVMCRETEMDEVQAVFGFDESTVLECTDLDESVRYGSFDGYDFISLVYMKRDNAHITLSEINIYAAAHYVVLVMPDAQNKGIREVEDRLFRAIQEQRVTKNWANMAVCAVFNLFLSDTSDLLEHFEDDAVALQDEIISRPDKEQFETLSHLRHMAYTLKKQLRASSNLGEEMLVDPNGLIYKESRRFFANIDGRLVKLYGFAENLYDLCDQLLMAYDSRMAIKTNDIVNKLTVLTVFFGPITIITGIYGMNFAVMPELNYSWGYPAALLLMMAVSLVIYWHFKRKKWL